MTLGAPGPNAADDDWFALIIEAAPYAFLMVDRTGTILFANRGAATLFGYEREELVGHKVERLVPPHFRGAHSTHLAGFFSAPEARRMGAGRELFGQRKDGSEVPIEIGLSPLETPQGLFTLASIIDITDRRRAEAAARESEERFRLMVEGVTDHTMLWLDREGHVASWNLGAQRMKGFSSEDVVGHHFSCLYPPEDAADGKPQRALETARTSGRYEGEGWRLRKDGSRFWANTVITAIRNERGELQGFSKMTRDLTQRRLAEERFELAVEAAPTGLVMVNREGTISLVNTQIEELFGYSRAELVGMPIETLVPERFRGAHPGHRRGFFSAPTSRAMGVGRDLYGLRKDGREFAVEIGLSPIADPEGGHVMASIIDITERKRNEDELRRSNSELEQFAYIASHDLQEPLRMVASYTELLAERYRGKLDDKADRYIHYAVDGAKRMQQLVADLLAYSRVGSQGRPLGPVSSQAAVKSVLDLLGRGIRDAGGDVEVGSLPMVLADDGQLRQLFQNLIGNALKFRAEAPPRIAIHAVQQGRQWLFSVKDNGIGIEMQYAEKIFMMFQRLHERGRYDGSGIGLTIAKRIVERHGGRIWLESAPGAGTTFFFTLQATHAEAT